MAHFDDLTAYVYMAHSVRPGTKNIGWLDAATPFPQSVPDGAFLTRLWAYCQISVVQTRGIHPCELCSAGTQTIFGWHGDESLLLGTAEIRVFGATGDIYAAPTLIYHYVKDHHYAPPEEFVHAVMMDPLPPDPTYISRLDRLALQWRKTTAGPSGPKIA